MIKLLQSIVKSLQAIVKDLKKLVGKQEKEEKKIPVIELAKAMAKMEGFGIEGALPTRNHNPGDLRRSKFQSFVKDGFAYFPDDKTGWKALVYDLCIKIMGKSTTGITPESSLRDLIYKWTATDQYAYLMFVASKLGISFEYKIKNFIC